MITRAPHVTLHPAERCLNELSRVTQPWYSKAPFDVIVKWMAVYYWRVRDGELPEPERPT